MPLCVARASRGLARTSGLLRDSRAAAVSYGTSGGRCRWRRRFPSRRARRQRWPPASQPRASHEVREGCARARISVTLHGASVGCTHGTAPAAWLLRAPATIGPYLSPPHGSKATRRHELGVLQKRPEAPTCKVSRRIAKAYAATVPPWIIAVVERWLSADGKEIRRISGSPSGRSRRR